MTVDDENSVYVGNLPYDSTEETIRTVFDIYGQIIAVKIICDRGVGGKCYGFVTYTNPRSAVNAINDMDGKTVNGRVVKVNQVKTRGGRSDFVRHNNNRDAQFDRGRDRDRDRDYGRQRDRSRDRDQGKERGYDRDRDLDHSQTKMDQDKDIVRRSGNKYKDQPAKLTNGSDLSERRSREYPSGSSHGDHDQVSKQLDISRQKMEELQKEVSRMEELVEERGDHVSKLQEKSQKLEDALASARKLTSDRKKQLTKLYKCFHNVKVYGEKLRISEEELQSLVGSTLKELESHNGFDPDELLG